jgi:putative transcriptional regulator
MSGHTAPDELLLDWATGALAPGPALAVALHVALDPLARRSAERLGEVGGALLEGEPAAALDEGALERTLARLDGVGVEPSTAQPPSRPGFEWAPRALRLHLAPGVDWRRAFGGFDEIRLSLPGDNHRVSLLRLAPGHGLPMHRHVGAELTVVLQGGYSDGTGSYAVGDFAVGPGPEQHEPIADPGPPCIALIVLEQPIVLTGRWGRWLNPLVRRGLI